MNSKICLMAASLSLLAACSSTSNNIDYNDDVDTPDVLLQDASGGDSDYGLDKNADKHNQQNKPDVLEQSMTNPTKTAKPANPTEPAHQPVPTQQSEPVPEVPEPVSVPTPQPKPVATAKPKQTPQPKQTAKPEPKSMPDKQESALEVDDPLLGEIDPI